MSKLFRQISSALSPSRSETEQVEETEEEAFARMIKESIRACEVELEKHLSNWLSKSTCPPKPIYEQWIAAVHPDNVRHGSSQSAIAIDPRLYLENDMHRRLWNKRAEREVNPAERRRRFVPARENGSKEAGAVPVVSLTREMKGRASLDELSALRKRLQQMKEQEDAAAATAASDVDKNVKAPKSKDLGTAASSSSSSGGGGGGNGSSSGSGSCSSGSRCASDVWPPGDDGGSSAALFASYSGGVVSGAVLDGPTAAEALKKTGTSDAALFRIWELADYGQDGALDAEEFSLALYLCRCANAGEPVPLSLPRELIPPSQRPRPKKNPFG